jgi:wyosine [tRNA(Phe)-imidazoG37] synthetase (radical SAM superfamily)
MAGYRYLFGPVQSRRLGTSLGIDMVRSTICSLDCVYCECGATSLKTLAREEYVSADAVIGELTDCLERHPAIDYITFGGRGEPTLNSALGRIVRYVKTSFPDYRCALLTNGTLFDLPEVREEALPFDLVLPNLDAVSDEAFNAINRPDPRLNNNRIIDGLAAFRQEYKGAIWLEIFIVPGVNDTEAELLLLKEATARIRPDRVQLNSLDRPGACDWVKPATPGHLASLAHYFVPLPVEIISRSPSGGTPWEAGDATPESILSLLERRPSTVEEISALTGLTVNASADFMNRLIADGRAEQHTVGLRTFFRIAHPGPSSDNRHY